ncbi:hypothetical protein DPMN_083381 [Dreissena polymorpha]|uniref:Uncharacterized protein n=1 Tax=Dreissena polymorpha TaxID=45954 RepID=A0A9D3Y9T3_DREPO|nr:hypothetical protein DPMN_083381 [Dreissena polymorpha]
MMIRCVSSSGFSNFFLFSISHLIAQEMNDRSCYKKNYKKGVCAIVDRRKSIRRLLTVLNNREREREKREIEKRERERERGERERRYEIRRKYSRDRPRDRAREKIEDIGERQRYRRSL